MKKQTPAWGRGCGGVFAVTDAILDEGGHVASIGEEQRNIIVADAVGEFMCRPEWWPNLRHKFAEQLCTTPEAVENEIESRIRRCQVKSDANSPDFPLISIGDALKLDLRPKYLIPGLIEQDTIAMIFGTRGSMKTFFMVDVVAAAVTGTPWHGIEIPEPIPAVYVAAESFTGIVRRFAGWSIARGVALANAPLLITRRPGRLTDDKDMAALSDTLARWADTTGHVPKLVPIDTFHRNMGAGDENSAEHVGHAIHNLDRYIRIPFGACPVLIHHSGHADGGRVRGSSALGAAVDAEFKCEEEDGFLTVTCTRMKEAAPGPPLYFRGRTVDLNSYMSPLLN